MKEQHSIIPSFQTANLAILIPVLRMNLAHSVSLSCDTLRSSISASTVGKSIYISLCVVLLHDAVQCFKWTKSLKEMQGTSTGRSLTQHSENVITQELQTARFPQANVLVKKLTLHFETKRLQFLLSKWHEQDIFQET